MKKILLLFGLVVLSIYNCFSQSNYYLYGPEGDVYMTIPDYYEAQGPNPDGTKTVEWKVTEGKGEIIDGDGVIYGSQLTTRLPGRIIIRWLSEGTATVNAQIKGASGGGYGARSWNVSIKSDKPIEYIQLNGKHSIKVGETQIYTSTEDIQEWIIDSQYFEKIYSTNREIKVKAKKDYKDPVSIRGKIHNYKFAIAWISISPDFHITPSNNIICNNESTSYNIDYFPTGTTITWQAGQNMTLISGQGTTTATFRGTVPSGLLADSKGIIKAIVKYNGIEYPIENSDVWIGAPPMQIISEATATDYPPYHAEFMFFDTGITDIQWTNIYPAESEKDIDIAKFGNRIRVTFVVPLRIATASSDFKFQAIVSNKCGSKTKNFILHPAKNPIFPLNGISSLKKDEKKISIQTITSSTPVSIQIYSFTSGELVYQDKKAVNFNINNTNIKKGIYIVKTTDAEGNVTQDKVMKTTD